MEKSKINSFILNSCISKMKGLTIISLVLLAILSLGIFAIGPTMTRTVIPLYGPPNQIFTVTLTATGTGGMEGIINETKPSTFTFYDKDSWGRHL